MPRRRKMPINGTAVLLTSRTQEGLPFIPCLLINKMLEAILARACSMYRISLCHYLFMSNHFHILAVVRDPKALADFMAQVKRETAWMINSFLGREAHTVWSASFDEPKILTPVDVLRYITYIYTNPVSARLVSSIDKYPGFSSWKWFINNRKQKSVRGYQRSTLAVLDSLSPSEKEQLAYLEQIFGESTHKNVLRLEPWAWLKCFRSMRKTNIRKLKAQIINNIRREEAALAAKYEHCMGAEALVNQPINSHHTPKKRGKRMLVLCSDIDLRKAFIQWFKKEEELAAKVIQGLIYGGSPRAMPPAFFLPGGFLWANLLGPPDFVGA